VIQWINMFSNGCLGLMFLIGMLQVFVNPLGHRTVKINNFQLILQYV